MKFVLFCLLFLVQVSAAVGQVTISGSVVSGEDLLPVIGATILEVGQSNGTTTDLDGRYEITLQDNAYLRVSFIGYKTQEIQVDGRKTIDIVLREDAVQLESVLVTAYGIEKDKKAAGFSFSEIGGEDLNTARDVSVASQLVGKVAGLDITKPSNGPSSATRIVLRGLSSFGGSDGPMIVIDGVPINNNNLSSGGLYGGRDSGDGFNALNPDDIENITVLKGPAASSLYGARAGSGVLIITTRKGKQDSGLGIEYSTNYTVDEVTILPRFQQEYGQGANGQKPTSQQESFDNWRSWGGRLDGSPITIFNGDVIPYSSPGEEDIRSFYNQGSTWTNSLSFSSGNEWLATRASLSQLANQSIIPNTSYERYTANLNVNVNLSKKVSLDGKLNFARELADNRTNLTDNPSNPAKYFIVGPNNLPQSVFQATRDDEGKPIYWSNNPFTLSPYWGPQEASNNDRKNRVIAYLSARWEIISGLSLQGRIATDQSNQDFFSAEVDGTQFRPEGVIFLDTLQVSQRNYDLIVNYKRELTDHIGLEVNSGTTRTDFNNRSRGLVGSGYIVSQLSEVDNMTNVFPKAPLTRKSRINALFTTATVSINDYFYLDGSFRRDFFSVLTNPRDIANSENAVSYGSTSLSFILSDAIKAPPWLTFAKLRLGYGTSGSIGQIQAYSLLPNYRISIDELKELEGGEAVTVGNILNDTYANPFLKPALTTGIEMGADVKFFDNRLGIEFTFYQQRTDKHIFNSPLPFSTGYGSYVVNAGEIQNRGVEVLLQGSLVRTKDFEWDLSLNFTKNVNKVQSLNEGVNELNFGPDRTFSANIIAREGGQIGDILGNVYARNEAGEIIHKDGLPQVADEKQVLGNFNPDWYGGFTSSFKIKNFALSFILDTKQGGEILSTTSSFGYLFGKHPSSLAGRENPDFMIIGSGVEEDGLTPNQTPARIDTYYERLSIISEENVYDASYVKLRQASLSYSLDPETLAKLKFIKGATVSLVGRNLFFLSNGLSVVGLDPESIYTASGGDVGIEYAALPSTRTYGVNINVKF